MRDLPQYSRTQVKNELFYLAYLSFGILQIAWFECCNVTSGPTRPKKLLRVKGSDFGSCSIPMAPMKRQGSIIDGYETDITDVESAQPKLEQGSVCLVYLESCHHLLKTFRGKSLAYPTMSEPNTTPTRYQEIMRAFLIMPPSLQRNRRRSCTSRMSLQIMASSSPSPAPTSCATRT